MNAPTQAPSNEVCRHVVGQTSDVAWFITRHGCPICLTERAAPEPRAINVAPVACLTVKDGDPVGACIYAPGLPDGEHELFPVPLNPGGQLEPFLGASQPPMRDRCAPIEHVDDRCAAPPSASEPTEANEHAGMLYSAMAAVGNPTVAETMRRAAQYLERLSHPPGLWRSALADKPMESDGLVVLVFTGEAYSVEYPSDVNGVEHVAWCRITPYSRPSKEKVCVVCREPWRLGHRCKPTPTPEQVGPFVVGDGGGTGETRFRTYRQGLPAWTLDIDEAMQFARRRDAEAFCAEDEDAWQILPVPRLSREPPAEPTPEMISQGIWAWQRNDRATMAEDVRAIYTAMRHMEERSTPEPSLDDRMHALAHDLMNAGRLEEAARLAPPPVSEYLKEGESVAQCIERNRRDVEQALGLLSAEKAKTERLTDDFAASVRLLHVWRSWAVTPGTESDPARNDILYPLKNGRGELYKEVDALLTRYPYTRPRKEVKP